MVEYIEFNKSMEHTLVLHYNITMHCNNRCSYCSVLPMLNTKPLVNQEAMDNVVAAANKFKDDNPHYAVSLYISGGEPLIIVNEVEAFINKLHKDIKVFVYANMNYKKLRVNDIASMPNVTIICSWHASSNQDFIKKNLLEYTGDKEISFLIGASNINEVLATVHWAMEHNIRYSIDTIRDADKTNTFTDVEDPRYQFMLVHSQDINNTITIGDEQINRIIDGPKRGIDVIAQQYHTVCRLSRYRISYDGEVAALCQYPFRDQVVNGIATRDVYCNKYRCVCDPDSYKKLYGTRNANS